LEKESRCWINVREAVRQEGKRLGCVCKQIQRGSSRVALGTRTAVVWERTEVGALKRAIS